MNNPLLAPRRSLPVLIRMRLFRYTSVIAVLFLLLAVAWPLARLFPDVMSQPVVPLHYNIHYGVDQTGVWWQLFTLPLLGGIFFVVNTVLALWFVRKDVMVTRMALVANVLLCALLFLAMMFVVSLNIVYG